MKCGYESREWHDDFECVLEAGHRGKHQVVLQWVTRPEDICADKGHRWGAWISGQGMRWSMWVIPPTETRTCLRCRANDFKGGEPHPDISDILVQSSVYKGPSLNLNDGMTIAGTNSVEMRWVADAVSE